nr:MAG TPA: hypothetical protein [Caudoviricetes sp.]
MKIVAGSRSSGSRLLFLCVESRWSYEGMGEGLLPGEALEAMQ